MTTPLASKDRSAQLQRLSSERFDLLVIGGGMVFTFLKARGLNTGSSLVEEDKVELAKELEAKAKKMGVQIILPTDVVLADKFDANANTQVAKVEAIPDGTTVPPYILIIFPN